MALETGTYIDDLVATNPVVTDGLKEADDHLRFIKSTILASFPNITGAMTATHTILNGLDARATALEGAAAYVPAVAGGTFTGAVLMSSTLGVTGVITASGGMTCAAQLIRDLADPELAQDAATKSYVDTADALACLKSANLSDVASAATARANISPLTTKGDLWGFSTVDARVAVGTDGELLQADSSAAGGVSWGGAEWVHIETSDTTGTSIDLTGLSTDAFDDYKLVFRGLQTSTDAVTMFLRLGVGVAAVGSGASDYSFTLDVQRAGGARTNLEAFIGAAYIQITGVSTHGTSNVAGEGVYGEIEIIGASDSRKHFIQGRYNWYPASSGDRWAGKLIGRYDGAAGVLGTIQLYPGSGNITGHVELWGRKTRA